MNKYKGVPYKILQNPRLFFPLAYIRIPEKHPWLKVDNYNDIPLDVHGGITFLTTITGKEKIEEDWHKFTPGTWLGWDYGHAGDFNYIISSLQNVQKWNKKIKNKFWQFDEIEEEIKDAINQMLNRS
ncbi:MAG TPA: hypothetical protein VEP90_05750 [Methylomirabilota bacterium]|nr:hypothetical protein [Methylomirabilota bacterium]